MASIIPGNHMRVLDKFSFNSPGAFVTLFKKRRERYENKET